MDAGSTLDVTEMYAFHGNAPFWEMFVRVIPFICVLNFGYQNAENRKRGTYFYVSLKVSAKEYWDSMAYANFILTFIQFEMASFLSMLLNRITFQETGVFFEGVKGTAAYWKNISGDYLYRWNDLHMNYPELYIFVSSILFSVFCAGLSQFLFAISLCIKENGLWIYVVAAGISLLFFETQYMLGYDIWGDVGVYANETQSCVPTLIIWLIFIMFAKTLLRIKQARWNHEE